MKRLLVLSLLSLFVFNASAQNLQYNRKTVLFHEAGYWCADDYLLWPTGLYDTINRVQNTPSFPSFYVEYDPDDSATKPVSQMLYRPSVYLAVNKLNTWANRPMMDVNFKSVLMDPNAYYDTNPVTYAFIYRRPYDTLSHYVQQETAAPNVTAIGYNAAILPNDSLVIDTRVKFQSATSSDYYVAVFILEDSLMAYTNNGSSYAMQLHHYGLRAACADRVFGWDLNSAAPIAAGKEYYTTFSKKIPAGWNKSHLSYLMITYRYDAVTDHYDIDNATKGAPANPATVSTPANAMAASFYPNPALDNISLSYSFAAASTRTEISLTDLSGKNIGLLYTGATAKEGNLSLPLPVLSNGIYLLNIRNEYGGLTKPLSIAR